MESINSNETKLKLKVNEIDKENKRIVFNLNSNSFQNMNLSLEKPVKQQQGVSDREILKIIKEEKRFPVAFSKRIKLGKLLDYYYKYWNNEFTDESDEDSWEEDNEKDKSD